jgi:hypothetical protein
VSWANDLYDVAHDCLKVFGVGPLVGPDLAAPDECRGRLATSCGVAEIE